MTGRGLFVGFGIDLYHTERLPNLDHAVADVQGVAERLAVEFDGEPLINVEFTKADQHLRSVEGQAEGRSLVLMWSGHGVDKGGLRLSTTDRPDGMAASEVIRSCVLSGANQMLFIVDTCQAGAALDATEQASRLLEQIVPQGDHVWFGVLVSCSATDFGARDGAFGKLLIKLLTKGPKSADQVRRWSRHNRLILGEDLGQALLEEWSGSDQRPDFLRRGSAWYVLPNPLFVQDAPEEVVEHLLRAARGGESADERSWFTGRTAEVDRVVSWVVGAQPGVRVVTGSAGTGKSAIVGRVVCLSNPEERARLQGRRTVVDTCRSGRGVGHRTCARTWTHGGPDGGSAGRTVSPILGPAPGTSRSA